MLIVVTLCITTFADFVMGLARTLAVDHLTYVCSVQNHTSFSKPSFEEVSIKTGAWRVTRIYIHPKTSSAFGNTSFRAPRKIVKKR